jgi:hypothetical protein
MFSCEPRQLESRDYVDAGCNSTYNATEDATGSITNWQFVEKNEIFNLDSIVGRTPKVQLT